VKSWSDLHPRERQAVTLVSRGLSLDEISREMLLNRKGVHFHIYNAMQKSGTSNLGELKDWTSRNMPA
jgi:DNA-binding CsgD family transcriptional regulator